LSLLIDQSPRGASSNSATSKKPSKPPALAEVRARWSQRQLLLSFNPDVIHGHEFVTSSRYIEAKAGGIMPARRSSFGADCAHCGKELIAPERSEYRDERHVHHIWRCPKCDHSFEVIWPADIKSVTDISTFLIALSAPISIQAAMAKLIITIMMVAVLTQNCYAQAVEVGLVGGENINKRQISQPRRRPRPMIRLQRRAQE
jgi:hypothetical protein